jgi:uncharacterized membrane protein YjjB (DUF3815 family)
MKKFIISVYFAALIVMFPAIFVGYLYNTDTTSANQPTSTQPKTSASVSDDTAIKPGLLFVIKGI